jgi:predicted transcriptional regulator
MADDSSAQKVDPSLVAEIVSSYVAKNSIGVDQIGGLIATVHRTLSGLGESASAPVPGPLEPAVSIRRSVQPDYVVCLECGFHGRTLRRHLRVRHGLEVDAYRARWKLPREHAGDGTGLFGSSRNDGKGDWARETEGSCRDAAGS